MENVTIRCLEGLRTYVLGPDAPCSLKRQTEIFTVSFTPSSLTASSFLLPYISSFLPICVYVIYMLMFVCL